MDPTASWLWRMAGEAAALYVRGGPGYEAHLTPTAWLVLSGQPVADFNIALIDQGSQAATRLRDYGPMLQTKGLPEAARLPLMVYRLQASGGRRRAPINSSRWRRRRCSAR